MNSTETKQVPEVTRAGPPQAARPRARGIGLDHRAMSARSFCRLLGLLAGSRAAHSFPRKTSSSRATGNSSGDRNNTGGMAFPTPAEIGSRDAVDLSGFMGLVTGLDVRLGGQRTTLAPQIRMYLARAPDEAARNYPPDSRGCSKTFSGGVLPRRMPSEAWPQWKTFS